MRGEPTGPDLLRDGSPAQVGAARLGLQELPVRRRSVAPARRACPGRPAARASSTRIRSARRIVASRCETRTMVASGQPRAQVGPEPVLVARVEARRAVVEQQQVGPPGERARDRDALLLPAAHERAARDRPRVSRPSGMRARSSSIWASARQRVDPGVVRRSRPNATFSRIDSEKSSRLLRHVADAPREGRPTFHARATARRSPAACPACGGKQPREERAAASSCRTPTGPTTATRSPAPTATRHVRRARAASRAGSRKPTPSSSTRVERAPGPPRVRAARRHGGKGERPRRSRSMLTNACRAVTKRFGRSIIGWSSMSRYT